MQMKDTYINNTTYFLKSYIYSKTHLKTLEVNAKRQGAGSAGGPWASFSVSM